MQKNEPLEHLTPGGTILIAKNVDDDESPLMVDYTISEVKQQLRPEQEASVQRILVKVKRSD
ncbi:hypothetical protein ACFSHT_28875 [Paraburkholderia silviterrae]|uniref:Uncharacterized protein n=1 Tax=Paraburkholderia silviterrae TaxID=2528715 RepID=A0A4R5M5D2_9BURK|nr:hypothetical protein [Paraburkholderia silviterrae]TDG21158.1 hypothetical protein EYW47_22575 [Paraburkholderia silviterrae]